MRDDGRNTPGDTPSGIFFFQVSNCSGWQLSILEIIFYAEPFIPTSVGGCLRTVDFYYI